jgi:hypothetical protein
MSSRSPKKAVLESVFLADDEGRIGVKRHVLLAVELVVQDVFDHAPEKSDVRTRTQRRVNVRLG